MCPFCTTPCAFVLHVLPGKQKHLCAEQPPSGCVNRQWGLRGGHPNPTVTAFPSLKSCWVLINWGPSPPNPKLHPLIVAFTQQAGPRNASFHTMPCVPNSEMISGRVCKSEAKQYEESCIHTTSGTWKMYPFTQHTVPLTFK